MRALLTFGSALAAAFALSTSGCTAMFLGINETELTFPLKAQPAGTFNSWNEITVDQDINSVTYATLVGVELTVAGAPDFTFLKSLQGAATPSPGVHTPLVAIEDIPVGVQTILAKVKYTGDLHPLFKDQHTIHIDWTGATNPAWTGTWPVDGFTITAVVSIDLEN